MTIDEAVEWLERGLEVKEGLSERTCQTGESYMTFSESGPKEEGMPSGGFDTEDLAIRYWLKYVLQYKIETTTGKNPAHYTLYWREKPQTHQEDVEGMIKRLGWGVDNPDWKWRVYSRFIITDRAERLAE